MIIQTRESFIKISSFYENIFGKGLDKKKIDLINGVFPVLLSSQEREKFEVGNIIPQETNFKNPTKVIPDHLISIEKKLMDNLVNQMKAEERSATRNSNENRIKPISKKGKNS